MLQIDPLNKSFSQKLQYPEKKINKDINPPKKQLFEKVLLINNHSCEDVKFYG